MRKWTKTTHRMAENHTWKATPGYRICVIQRGDLQFEVPQEWHITPEENALRVTDKPPPDDDCVLQVSVLRFPPLKAGRPSLTVLLQQTIMEHGHISTKEEIHTVPREDVKILWGEYREIDPKENRLAIWRVGMCESLTATDRFLMALFTFGFWPEDEARCASYWDHMLKTLIMDRPVEDPTKGPRLH